MYQVLTAHFSRWFPLGRYCHNCFRLFNTVVNKQMFNLKNCRWLDSNCGPLVSEATAQPTKPQPLPHINSLWADVVVDVFLKRSGLEEFLNFYIKLHHDWSSSTFPIPKFESYYSIKVFSFSLSSISPFLTFKSAPTLLQHRRPNL